MPPDLGLAVERRARPRLRKVAPLGEEAAGGAQAVDRAAALGGDAEGGHARAPQRPPQPLGRLRERLLQPRAEGARVETIRLNVGEHGEQRIDARFDRTLAQQLGAETVNRVHVRLLSADRSPTSARSSVLHRSHAAPATSPIAGRLRG